MQNTDAVGRYKTIEASLNKRMSRRWSLGVGAGYTWTEENAQTYRGNTVSPSIAANTPNDTSFHEFTTFGFHAYGNVEGPWGVRFSPVLRYTQGTPYGRTVTVNNASPGPFFSGTILVEPVGTRRMDDVVLLDLKTEKTLSLGGSRRLRAFIDLYNLFNSNAADTISFATGSTFADPTNIIGPVTARLGARFEW